MNEPWGHKITISFYVEGELPYRLPVIAAQGAEYANAETYDAPLESVRISSQPIQEKPKDQGAS